jgi:hypothetical protein
LVSSCFPPSLPPSLLCDEEHEKNHEGEEEEEGFENQGTVTGEATVNPEEIIPSPCHIVVGVVDVVFDTGIARGGEEGKEGEREGGREGGTRIRGAPRDIVAQ